MRTGPRPAIGLRGTASHVSRSVRLRPEKRRRSFISGLIAFARLFQMSRARQIIESASVSMINQACCFQHKACSRPASRPSDSRSARRQGTPLLLLNSACAFPARVRSCPYTTGNVKCSSRRKSWMGAGRLP